MTKDGGMKVMKHGAAKDSAAGRSVQEVRAILVAQVVNLEAAVRAVDAEGAGRLSLAALAEALLVLSDMEALALTRDEVERLVSAVGAGDGTFFENQSAGGMVDIATFLAHFRHSPPGPSTSEVREVRAWAGGAATTGHELGLDASSHARVPPSDATRGRACSGAGGVGSTSIMLRGSSVVGHAVHVAEAGVFSVLNSSAASKRQKAKADVDVLRVATRSNPNIDLLTTIAHAAWARKKKDMGSRGGGKSSEAVEGGGGTFEVSGGVTLSGGGGNESWGMGYGQRPKSKGLVAAVALEEAEAHARTHAEAYYYSRPICMRLICVHALNMCLSY
jgi:hypothetical protein